MIGQTLGHYRVLEKLGAGGMGVVYRAHDTQLDRDVALKVLPSEALADDKARARLLREARLASQLNHPNICTIHEVGEANGQAFIAMELVEGRPLSAHVADGALPIEQVLRHGLQVADALAHAHERRVVHRDLKSANVMITPEGRAKVLDFGLAKRLTDDELLDATTMTRDSLTVPGVVAGTLAYMAPEQLRGQPANERSDIWALGVMLHELAAGARPFQGQTGFELTSAILKEPPQPLPSTVPAPLRAVVARCLTKESGGRYQRGSDVQAALEAVRAGTATVPWPGWRGALRSRWALGAAGGVAAVLVVAAVMFSLDVGGVRTRLAGASSGPTHVIRLAVLPFENPSGDADQEYFSDGQTQEMIAQLGRLHPDTLLVKARASVMRYKKIDKPIDQVGRELGVEYILEGSAQRSAKRVQIWAELIRVADQTQVWGSRFEREEAGVLALQNEVAQRVADALAIKLLPAEQARLANAGSVNPEAYDAYLKGSHYWLALTRTDLDTAEKYFDFALQKDPKYAAAYAGIALVWACRQQMGFARPSEAGPKARAAATKAVELDDASADAHFALADIMTWTDWNWAGAEGEWKRAVELNPSNADALATHSHFLMITGRQDQAMAQIERALDIDPFNVIVRSFYAVDLLCARRYDEAIAQARVATRSQPDAPIATAALISALHEKKRYGDVISTAAAFYGGAAYGWRGLGDALKRDYAELGYAAAWRRAAETEWKDHGQEPGIANDAASNFMFGGDMARALDMLEKAHEERDPNLPYLRCWPLWDPLRSDPRFQSLLRRMGLAQ
jgi:eukaryotic-like serine/threonine-protein kinase